MNKKKRRVAHIRALSLNANQWEEVFTSSPNNFFAGKLRVNKSASLKEGIELELESGLEAESEQNIPDEKKEEDEENVVFDTKNGA